jgi:hypothetical protein
MNIPRNLRVTNLVHLNNNKKKKKKGPLDFRKLLKSFQRYFRALVMKRAGA